MSVRTDVINLNVNVNGNQAQNQLNDLKKKAAETRFEMDGLKKGTQAYIDKKKELATITAEMDNLKKQIGLTSLTQKELIQELNRLKSLKGSVVPFSKEFNDLQKSIEGVEKRLYDVRNGVQGFASFMSKIKDEVKQFGVMAAAYLGFEFITNQFSSIISGAGKLSDSLADIRKNTGLSSEGVNDLNKELKSFDTRTTNQSLRDLAIDAGKLGIEGKNAILEFIEAGDQINVALGEDLGKDAVKDIGKLVDIFRLKEEFGLGDSMLKIGSSINDVGASSAASEPYIVDFLKRMGGIGPSAKIPIPDLIALAGTLDSLGQTSETSATAVGNTISKLVTDFDGFGKIAGTTGEKLKQTFNEKGGLAALQQVLQGVKNAGGNFDDLVAKLGDVGIEGSKAKGVFAVLANNLDILAKQQGIANDSFDKGISLTTEFNIKNATFGATLDKLGKEFNSLMTSPGVTNFLKGAAEGAMNFIKFMKELPQWLEANRTSLILLAGVVVLYTGALIKSGLAAAAVAVMDARLAAIRLFNNGILGAGNVLTNISIALQAAYIQITGVLTGRITLATAALRIWNVVLAASGGVFGLIVIAITAVAGAISFLSKKYTELSNVQKTLQEIQRKGLQSTADEEARIRSLTAVVSSNAISLDTRKKALQELIAINPQYLSGLTLENIKTQEGINILKNYVAMLREKALVQAATESQAEKLKEDIRLQELEVSLEKKIAQKKGGSVGDLSEEEQEFVSTARKQFNFSATVGDIFTGGGAAKSALEGIRKKRKEIEEELKVTDDIVVKNFAATVKGEEKKVEETGKKIIRTVKLINEDIQREKEKLENSSDRKTSDAINARIRDLERERNAITGEGTKKTKAEKSGESEYARLKKEAAQFAKDIKKFRQDVEVDETAADQKEVERLNQKYEELQARALKYFKKHVTTKGEYQAQEKELEELFIREMQVLTDKRLEKEHAKEYDNSLQLSAQHFDGLRNQAGRNYADGLIDKKQYEASLKDIEKREVDSRVIISNDYSATVKKAAADVTKYRADQEKKTTQDAIEETDKRKEIADQEKLARANLAVIQSRPGSDGRLEAQKNQLQVQFELESEYMDKKSAMYLEKEAKLREDIKNLEKQHSLDLIDEIVKYVGFFQDAMASLNTIVSNRENKMLAEERKRNDTKKKDYKGQLDNKLLSQAQYDKKVQAIDEEQQKREKEVRRKQAQREKAMAIFNAVINTAAAVAKALPDIPLAIIAGVLGGLQVAAIASTPLPELGDGDWIRKGAKHKDPEKGIPVMIERDEAVMKAAAMTDPNVFTVTGTTAQITSALNSRAGGVDWAGGGIIQMPRYRTERSASINPNMPRIMEQGGVVRSIDGRQPDNTSSETTGLLRQLIAEQQQTREAMNTWQTKIKGEWVIKDLDETRAKYDNAKKSSGMNQ